MHTLHPPPSPEYIYANSPPPQNPPQKWAKFFASIKQEKIVYWKTWIQIINVKTFFPEKNYQEKIKELTSELEILETEKILAEMKWTDHIERTENFLTDLKYWKKSNHIDLT